MGSSSCFMSASTTLRTTSRAVSLVFSGMMPRSDMSVDTRFTSGCTLSSISGWSSILCRLRRSKASFCMTCTTEDGKKRRMSPSQRATRGDEAPLPPRRLCLLSASYSAASASSICRSSGLSRQGRSSPEPLRRAPAANAASVPLQPYPSSTPARPLEPP